MLKKFKKIGSIALSVLVWLIIALAAFFVFFTLSSAQNGGVPKMFGYSPMTVLSDSMAGDKPDSFTPNDLIVIRSVGDHTLKVGDIITFYDLVDGRTEMVTHRIIRIDETGTSIGPLCYTQGDKPGAPEDDNAKSLGDIIGVYQFKITNAGVVFDFLKSQTGFMICLVIPLALFFLWRLIKLVMVVIEMKNLKAKEELEAAVAAATTAATPEAPDDGPTPSATADTPAQDVNGDTSD